MERVVLIQRGKVLRDGPKREVLRSAPLSDLFEIPVEVLERNGYYHVL
jgi:iron complex transport system ATP-binding protein